MPESALDLATLLAELGFDPGPPQARAREALIRGQLTREGKTRIDAGKRPRVEALLAGRFLVTCGKPACDGHAAGREVVHSEQPTACAVCGGSTNRRSVTLAAEAFAKAGVRKLVVVGGSPSVHEELLRLKPPEWELRLVDGTVRRTLDLARADVRWADLVLVWGSSELDHRVSEHYTRETDRRRLVTLNRRGIAALMDAATLHLSRRR